MSPGVSIYKRSYCDHQQPRSPQFRGGDSAGARPHFQAVFLRRDAMVLVLTWAASGVDARRPLPLAALPGLEARGLQARTPRPRSGRRLTPKYMG